MDEPYGLGRRPVQFARAPLSHVWIFGCVVLGAAIFLSAYFLGMSELLVWLRRFTVEAITRGGG